MRATKQKTTTFILLFTSILIFPLSVESKSPYLFVLGVGQDGGAPQAGCFSLKCVSEWKTNQRVFPTSLALIDPVGKKYLFEATPNLPEQMIILEKEAPSNQFLLDGVFITHAHIGHYAGLIFFGREVMGSKGIPLYLMPEMENFIRSNGPWSQLVKLRNVEIKQLKVNKPIELSNVAITPFLVPHRDEFSETVGFSIRGPNRKAIFIPDINKWSEWDQSLIEVVKDSNYVLIDATFYKDGELPGRDMSKIPHPFVTESMSLLSKLPYRERGKVWFIHMNHTNPLLNVDSEESKFVKNKGFNIARRGDRFIL